MTSVTTLPVVNPRKPLSVILRELCATGDNEVFTLGEIVDRFGRRSFGALLFIFAIPNALPLPPGGTTIVGLPLLLFAPQVAIGARAPWLPRKLRDRTIKGADLDRMFGKAIPRLERVEHLSRPRLTFLFGPVGDIIIGILCTLLALIIILPIPLGNLFPAINIAVLSLALFNRDGVLALIGYLMAAASVVLTILGAAAIIATIKALIHYLGG